MSRLCTASILATCLILLAATMSATAGEAEAPPEAKPAGDTEAVPEKPAPGQPVAGENNKAKVEDVEAEDEEEDDTDLEKPRQITMVRWFQALTSSNQKKRDEATETILEYKRWTGPEIRRNIHTYPRKRRQAMLPLLREMNTVESRYALAGRAMFDKDQKVRLGAAEAVFQMGGATARRFIVARALDEDERVRRKVARAIANIKDPAIIDALIPETAYVLATRDQGAVELSSDNTPTQVNTFIPGLPPGRVTVRRRQDKERASEEVYVPTLEMVLKRDDDIKKIAKWWKEHRDTFDWPNLEGKD